MATQHARNALEHDTRSFVVRVFDSWWQLFWAAGVTTCGALAILILVSNTFSASAKVLWADCADNWLAVWTFLRENFSTYNLAVYGSFVVHASVYWLCSAAPLYVDLKHPERWEEFKIQEGTNSPLDIRKVVKVILVTTRNLFIAIPLLHLCYRWMDPARVFSPELPSFNRMIFEIVCFILVEEVMFYYAHRLLHTPRFYGRIHKQHHEWTSPIGLVALYAHPVEHVLSNLLPVITGPMLMQSHLMVVWVWAAFAMFTSVFSHCGYHLPFMSSPEAHDFHHLKFNEIFGVLGVLDYLHGTDVKFRESRQFELHKTYFTDAYKNERIRKEDKQTQVRKGTYDEDELKTN